MRKKWRKKLLHLIISFHQLGSFITQFFPPFMYSFALKSLSAQFYGCQSMHTCYFCFVLFCFVLRMRKMGLVENVKCHRGRNRITNWTECLNFLLSKFTEKPEIPTGKEEHKRSPRKFRYLHTVEKLKAVIDAFFRILLAGVLGESAIKSQCVCDFSLIIRWHARVRQFTLLKCW